MVGNTTYDMHHRLATFRHKWLNLETARNTLESFDDFDVTFEGPVSLYFLVDPRVYDFWWLLDTFGHLSLMLGQTESIRTQDLTQDLTQDPLVTDAEPLPFAKKGYRMLQVASNFTNSTHMGGVLEMIPKSPLASICFNTKNIWLDETDWNSLDAGLQSYGLMVIYFQY